MVNKSKERYVYFILKNNNPVYVKEKEILDVLKNYSYFEINSDNQNSFVNSIEEFIEKNNDNKLFIVIDADNIDNDTQEKLSYMVKDRTYQTLTLPENTKIIVTGDKDKMNKKMLGLLVLVDD